MKLLAYREQNGAYGYRYSISIEYGYRYSIAIEQDTKHTYATVAGFSWVWNEGCMKTCRVPIPPGKVAEIIAMMDRANQPPARDDYSDYLSLADVGAAILSINDNQE